MIQTEEADPPLQQFPAILRQQIAQYLEEKNDKKPGSFISGSTSFRIFETSDGEPAHFVVSGTREPLDAGLYRYGIRKKGRHITVVQPKAGSTTFNNGEPAIIAYFSKGKKNESASRFAVWSPSGAYRNDIFIDRVRGRPSATVPSPLDPWAPLEPAIKVEDTATPQYPGLASHVNEDRPGLPVILPQQYYHDDEDSSLTIPPSSSFYRQSQGSSPFPSAKTDRMLKRDRSPSVDNEYEKEYTHSSPKRACHKSPASEFSVVFPEITSSLLSPDEPTSDTRDNIIFNFKDDSENAETLLSKTLRQCDSVHKFFAYARMAKISDHKHAMLAAQVNDDIMVLIVRDDDSTLEELLEAIKKEQDGEDQEIQIDITPADY